MFLWVLRAASAVFVLDLLVVLSGASGSQSVLALLRSDPVTTTTTSTTTTTTAPPIFPALADEGPVVAVRIPSGLVLPVTGGTPGAWQVMTPCAGTAVVAGEPLRRAHVVIDPGHGGDEPGAVGPAGLREKDLNLAVASRAAAKLEARGATVVLTRTSDVRVTLQTRGTLAQALRPTAFISVHHNAAHRATGQPSPGTQLYYRHGSGDARRLAGLLWEELQAGLRPLSADWAVSEPPGARARLSTRGEDFYGVIRRSGGVPAVLVESAFLSHPPEEAVLASEAFQEAEAAAIAAAVERLVRTPDPGSGYIPDVVSDAPAGGGGGPEGCIDPPLG